MTLVRYSPRARSMLCSIECRGLQSIVFHHGMFRWLGIHLVEFDGDYRPEMLKQ